MIKNPASAASESDYCTQQDPARHFRQYQFNLFSDPIRVKSADFKIKLLSFSFGNQIYLKRKSFRNQMKLNKDLVPLLHENP
jgi:hypothetical protein